MTNVPATPPQRNPWARRAIIIFVVIVVILVAGDIGNNLRTKSAVTKAADATSSWSPSLKKFCGGLLSLNQGFAKRVDPSSAVLVALETTSVSSPTSALHTLFSSMAQDYANLFNDPQGLATVNASSDAVGTTVDLRSSPDPKVAAFAKVDYAVVNDARFIKPISNAVIACAPAVANAARKTALAAVANAARSGSYPITAAVVRKDLPSGTKASVLLGHPTSGVSDFIFLFVNGPTLCVTAPQAPSAPAPALTSCS
jgi:hypothetical protein